MAARGNAATKVAAARRGQQARRHASNLRFETFDAHVRAAFLDFTDFEGTIGPEELILALDSLGLHAEADDAEEALNNYSSDGVCFSISNFAALVDDIEKQVDGPAPIRKTSLAREQVDAVISSTFVLNDAKGDGELHAEEVRAALLDLGMEVTIEEATEYLEVYDVDSGGTLDLFEFSRLCSDMSLRS